jgi:adenylate kinase
MEETGRRAPFQAVLKMNIIFLGAQGVGKGTYADMLAETLHVPHISTGDLFRAEVKNGTALGMNAQKFMERGELVPDEIVLGMLKSRISQQDCTHGFILEGFPRTLHQAEVLGSEIQIDRVFLLSADETTIINRLSGRRTCSRCNAIYHIMNIPPKQEGICDKCGGILFQRKDDVPETIKKRLQEFREKTSKVVDYYKNKNMLIEIDTNPSYDKRMEVLKSIQDGLID